MICFAIDNAMPEGIASAASVLFLTENITLTWASSVASRIAFCHSSRVASKPQTSPCTASEPVTAPLCLATVLQEAETQNSSIFTTCPDGFTTSVEPLLIDHGGPPFEVFCTLPSLHFAKTIFGGIFLLPSH